MHEDKIAGGELIAQRQNFTKIIFKITKTNFHEGTKLHEDNFAPRVNFAWRFIFARVKKTVKVNILKI